MADNEVIFLDKPEVGKPVRYLHGGNVLQSPPLTWVQQQPSNPSMFRVKTNNGALAVGRYDPSAGSVSQPPPVTAPQTPASPPLVKTKTTVKWQDLNHSEKSYAVGISAVALIVIILIVIVSARPYSPTQYDAYGMAMVYVDRELKCPSSSVYPPQSDPAVYICEYETDKFTVAGYVDAQNSFGAPVRSKYVCSVHYVGSDNWEPVSLMVNGVTIYDREGSDSPGSPSE